YWCFDCGSALAEAEIEYQEKGIAGDRRGLRRTLVRGAKPVYWCFDCGSALAEAEIEYQEKGIAGDRRGLRRTRCAGHRPGVRRERAGDVEVAVPIWTTTPWTLPASLAVSLGAEITYVLA
ncbi:hypothetical protein C7E17_23850, partial [Stenotrophomonas maltophilia]